MDLNSMSVSELRRLQNRIATEILRRNDVAKKVLLRKMKKMAEEEGLSFDEVIGEAAQTSASESKSEKPGRKRGPKPMLKKGGKLPLKYFHPENPAMGWSGHGRKPQWIIDWLSQNKPLELLEKKTTETA